ncbi:DUF6941 family protein [Streptomyces sp. NPDC059373]
MPSPIEAQLILCDAAQAEPATGKIHMLGAGWSQTSSPTAPMGLAVLIKVPWDRANEKITMLFSLLDSDGQPVAVQTPAGPQAISSQGQLEVGRPPGLAHGSSIDASFALNVSPLPIPPGRYQWRLDLANEIFSVFFTVRATPQVP